MGRRLQDLRPSGRVLKVRMIKSILGPLPLIATPYKSSRRRVRGRDFRVKGLRFKEFKV